MKLTCLTSGVFIASVALILLPSCVEPPPGSESEIWQRAPRYGHGGTESSPTLPGQKGKTKAKTGASGAGNTGGGGRFGFNGNSAENSGDQPETEVKPAERERDPVAKANPDKPVEEPKEEPKKSGGAPSVSQMPFAKGVPGKPLSVTLPGSNSGLGEISIEQFEGGKPSGKPLPPGTPVEIPDPNSPGKKIYFRVP